MNTKIQTVMKQTILLLPAFIMLILFSCATAGRAEESAQSTPSLNHSLSLQQQKIVSIAAFTANGDRENLIRSLNEGLDSGLTVNEIGEVLLQLYAYAGFPRSLNGTAALTSVLEERQAAGIRDPFGREPDLPAENTDKYALGVANLSTLIGFPLNQQKADTNGYNQAMDAFLKEHLFADIFGRNTLSFDMRELATVAALCSLEGTNSQMMFHMNSAINTGITEEQMADLVEIVTAELGTARGDNAADVLARVIDRRNAAPAAKAPAAGEYSYIPELFPLGKAADNPKIFTGTSYIAPLAPFETTGIPIVNVTFSPDSRTTWHSHSYIQVLLATMGTGYYQEEGREPVKMKAGDTATIMPGVKHWHGSAPGQWFAHVTIIIPVDSGEEDLWLDPVDDEYFSSLR